MSSIAPTLSIIVARADNGVIGANNQLPWHLPEDLRHFKRLTVGKPVIMGRKTFTSIGRPLPGRHNIVLTRQPDWWVAGVTVVDNLAEAIAATGLDPQARAEEVMIIGGAEIYALCLPLARRIYLTEVHMQAQGEVCFPTLATESWHEVARNDRPAAGAQPSFSFVTLERAA